MTVTERSLRAQVTVTFAFPPGPLIAAATDERIAEDG